MKHALLAAVALAGLMEEASETNGGSGAAPVDPEATQPETTAAEPAQVAPDVADTSGDTAGEPAGAHLDAPAAQPQAEEQPTAVAAPAESEDEFQKAAREGKPRIALVGKYSDRVPVQLKSQGHYDTLVAEHGTGSVELQGEGA